MSRHCHGKFWGFANDVVHLTFSPLLSTYRTTQAYQSLVAKHAQLAQEHRKLLEQWGDAAVSDQVEELLAVRQQLADLVPRYDAACDQVADLREKLRQLDLPSTLALKANPAFSTPSCRPQVAAAAFGSQSLTTTDSNPVSATTAREVQLQLNQDLVAATVKLDSANRRLEVLEREKDRLNKSLEDSQVSFDWISDATCCRAT
jgi:hypothetical protein